MEAKRILNYLRDIAANNNRPWYLEHKAEYDACRKSFNDGIAKAINRIAEFDDEVAHLQVKDCVYRFNRDTRFSPDKSPYKRHLGGYICAKGKKSLRGGYYIHLEPGNCLLATGSYWLPTNILTSCRNRESRICPSFRSRGRGKLARIFHQRERRKRPIDRHRARLRPVDVEDLSIGFPTRLRAHPLPSYEGLLLLASGR